MVSNSPDAFLMYGVVPVLHRVCPVFGGDVSSNSPAAGSPSESLAGSSHPVSQRSDSARTNH